MKFKVTSTRKFEKVYKRIKKRGYELTRLKWVVRQLEYGKTLPESYRVHKLSGDYKDCWERHIQPDWLRIHKIQDDRLCAPHLRQTLPIIPPNFYASRF